MGRGWKGIKGDNGKMTSPQEESSLGLKGTAHHDGKGDWRYLTVTPPASAPLSPIFGIMKVIPYRVPGNRAHTVGFRYAMMAWPTCRYLNL